MAQKFAAAKYDMVIGIGTSANLGGTTKAACHFDGMMYRPTLKLDGRAVLEGGELRI